jgi:hypothetical protein
MSCCLGDVFEKSFFPVNTVRKSSTCCMGIDFEESLFPLNTVRSFRSLMFFFNGTQYPINPVSVKGEGPVTSIKEALFNEEER